MLVATVAVPVSAVAPALACPVGLVGKKQSLGSQAAWSPMSSVLQVHRPCVQG